MQSHYHLHKSAINTSKLSLPSGYGRWGIGHYERIPVSKAQKRAISHIGLTHFFRTRPLLISQNSVDSFSRQAPVPRVRVFPIISLLRSEQN